MQEEIVDFINSQRVCVIAFEMEDGSPHGSTVHMAYDNDSQTFFFETYDTYRKGKILLNKEKIRASIVVGLDEEVKRTLQLDGEARIITPEEKDLFDRVYLGKFPEKVEKSKDPKFVFFCFNAKWWRFTNWRGKTGKEIITFGE